MTTPDYTEQLRTNLKRQRRQPGLGKQGVVDVAESLSCSSSGRSSTRRSARPAMAKLVVALIGIHGLGKQETCRWTNSISTGRLPFDERLQWQVWSLD